MLSSMINILTPSSSPIPGPPEHASLCSQVDKDSTRTTGWSPIKRDFDTDFLAKRHDPAHFLFLDREKEKSAMFLSAAIQMHDHLDKVMHEYFSLKSLVVEHVDPALSKDSSTADRALAYKKLQEWSCLSSGP